MGDWPKIWFTTETPKPSFESDTTTHRSVSHDLSRKRFLTRNLGFSAAGALATRPVAPAIAAASKTKADGPAVAFRFRPQARAIARRDGTA
jgi:hypothetical protein